MVVVKIYLDIYCYLVAAIQIHSLSTNYHRFINRKCYFQRITKKKHDFTCVGSSVSVGDVLELVDGFLRRFEGFPLVTGVDRVVGDRHEQRLINVVILDRIYRIFGKQVGRILADFLEGRFAVPTQIESGPVSVVVLEK